MRATLDEEILPTCRSPRASRPYRCADCRPRDGGHDAFAPIRNATHLVIEQPLNDMRRGAKCCKLGPERTAEVKNLPVVHRIGFVEEPLRFSRAVPWALQVAARKQ